MSISGKKNARRFKDGLTRKFTVTFILLIVIILILCGITTYLSQMNIYKEQCADNVRDISEHLASLMMADGDSFMKYQEYFLKNRDNIDIPMEASEYLSYYQEYRNLFEKTYPGKTLGRDITFDELSTEVKDAYLRYMQVYWLLTFEKARTDFDVPYTYYFTLDDTSHEFTFIIDGARLAKEKGIEDAKTDDEIVNIMNGIEDKSSKSMRLGSSFVEEPEENPVLWRTWETGKVQNEYNISENVWGATYTYYVPVIINGSKLGVIGTEIDIQKVNTEILNNTVRQLVVIAAILILSLIGAIVFINKRYIAKIVNLESGIKSYSINKDVSVVKTIEKSVKGNDEISSLSEQLVSMIIEIENYIRSITKITTELQDTKQQASAMSELAQKDALTGIRNKTAYDKEVQKLEWGLTDGENRFGLAMIDLNFLKRINDTYGHDKGNLAIKKICYIVCHVFEHSPVFRIGGDEFVVILKGNDYDHIDDLLKEFRGQLDQMQSDETLEPWEQISAAIGVAFFDKTKDTSVQNVFKRADSLMYENKKEMKAIRQ